MERLRNRLARLNGRDRRRGKTDSYGRTVRPVFLSDLSIRENVLLRDVKMETVDRVEAEDDLK